MSEQLMRQTTILRATRAWYAVHCQPLKERRAAAALHDLLGLTVYLPEVRRLFRGELQQAPFFPRYLFVRANLHEVSPSAINTTPGVVRLVTIGDTPQPIPARVIAAIQENLDRLDEQGGLPRHNYQPGDTVQLRSGPLRGMEAVFMGPMQPSERARVLVKFLGELREIDIDVGMLEDAKPEPRRERRTRGKGRHIDKV